MSSLAIAVPRPSAEWAINFDELTHAIAEDRRLSGSAGHRLLARRNPCTIVVAGLDDAAIAGDVELLRRQIESTLPHARFVDYDRAVAWAEELADQIREAIDELDHYHVHPVARGGLFVAGLLSYLLPLRKDQFFDTGPANGAQPVLVIDDIAISGLRLGSVLRRLGPRPTVVATLCAPEPLAAAVQSREPSVETMLHAVTLPDRTSELVDDDPERYQAKWKTDDVYWVGRTDHVVFSWSEPESEATNPVTGVPSPGWKLAPGSRCLGNRSNNEPTPILWDAVPADRSPVAAGWIIGREDDTTIAVRDSGSGSALALEGAAHEMFWARIETEGREAALARLADRYDIDAAELATDYRDFLVQLTDAGLLVQGQR